MIGFLIVSLQRSLCFTELFNARGATLNIDPEKQSFIEFNIACLTLAV